jgi:predicted nucleotidyltransferase
MYNDWLNQDSDDDFNPEDHNIEMDEIAKMYAIEDMKESQREWAREQAEKFYKDFEELDVKTAIHSIKKLIKTKEVSKDQVITMLNNMISIFKNDEEYERCHICLQIKNGL